jgi:hypothetical protein
LAVSLARGDDPQTYAQDSTPIMQHMQMPPNADATAANTVTEPLIPLEDDLLPPNTRRQPGRPKKRRIRGGTEGGDR